jgi:hypothetical protein
MENILDSVSCCLIWDKIWIFAETEGTSEGTIGFIIFHPHSHVGHKQVNDKKIIIVLFA